MEAVDAAGQFSPQDLWLKLARFDLFSHFTEAQRAAFLRRYEREPGMHVRQFSRGQLICKKGEYELDLCFILEGAVDLYDEAPDGSRVKVATLPKGTFYGEHGSLGGLPRSTDVVASADGAELFYLPRYCLNVLISNAEARQVVTDRYRDRAVRVLAQELDLFKGVSHEFIDQLIGHCEIEHYSRSGFILLRQGEDPDAFYIVRDGYVQVERERPDGTKRIIAYLRAGEFFGEMALLGGGKRYANVVTAGKCELVKIRGADFLALCKEYPGVEARVRTVVERRLLEEERVTPEISEMLKESGQLGYIQTDALLVMDLDLCVKCDSCVKACESLHGESRLVRTGVPIGKYLVPAACRHCDDPKCMNACPTGAVKRRQEGEIYFQYDMCIGCGNCATACPYDNIAMVETSKFDHAQAKKAEVLGRDVFRPYPVASHSAAPGVWERIFGKHHRGARERIAGGEFSQIRDRNDAAMKAGAAPAHAPIPSYPIKCDLCDGLPFMGCVHNCPTGAAMRIESAAELFKQIEAVSYGPARVRKALGGSD